MIYFNDGPCREHVASLEFCSSGTRSVLEFPRRGAARIAFLDHIRMLLAYSR